MEGRRRRGGGALFVSLLVAFDMQRSHLAFALHSSKRLIPIIMPIQRSNHHCRGEYVWHTRADFLIKPTHPTVHDRFHDEEKALSAEFLQDGIAGQVSRRQGQQRSYAPVPKHQASAQQIPALASDAEIHRAPL